MIVQDYLSNQKIRELALPVLVATFISVLQILRLNPQHWYIYLTCVVSGLIVGYLFHCLKMAMSFLADQQIAGANKIVLGLGLLMPLLAIGADWPGFVSYDDLNILLIVSDSKPSPWHSMSYSILVQSLLDLFEQPFFIWIFNFAIYTRLLLILFSFGSFAIVSAPFLVSLYLVYWPFSSLMVFFQNRDSTYSALICLVLLGLFHRKNSVARKLHLNHLSIFIFAYLLTDLRQEGKILIFLLPLYIFFLFSREAKMALRYFVALAGSLIFSVLIPSLYGLSPYSPIYKATSLLNPVSFIINERGVQSLDQETILKIDNFVSVQAILSHPNPYDIDAFHAGGFDGRGKLEDFEQFRVASLKLIIENFDLYLKNRWLVFLRMTNISPSLHFFDDLRNPNPNPAYREGHPVLGFKQKSLLMSWHEKIVYYWVDYSTTKLPWLLHVLLSSALVPLLLLLFFVVKYRDPAGLWLPSALILARTVVIMLLAPAAYFKYIGSSWFMGWALLLIYLVVGKRAQEK